MNLEKYRPWALVIGKDTAKAAIDHQKLANG